jgi:hypothetical protein
MSLRSQEYLQQNPCYYKNGEFEKSVNQNAQQTTKIKKQIPKVDENGNIVYTTITIPVKSGGCACKKNNTQTTEKQVPIMVDVWEDVSLNQPALPVDTSPVVKYVNCKLFGTIKRTICENCRTYRKK